MKSSSLLLSLATMGLALRLAIACHVAAFPYQLDYEEGNILNAASRIVHGATPYPEPGSFPYVLNPYGPLGYLSTAAVVKLSGLSLRGPRLIVALESLVVALLIACLVRWFGGLWPHGLVAGFWYLCTPISWYWIPLLRVDILAVAFSLSGLYLFANSRRGNVGPSLFFAFALLTKHSVVAGVLTTLMSLVIARRWRSTLVTLLILVTVMVIGIAASGGNAPFHLLFTHPDPYLVAQAMWGYSVAFGGALVAIAIILYGCLIDPRCAAMPPLLVTYLVVAIVTALTSGKLGSGLNHFLELTAAIAIAAGVVLSRLWIVKDSAAVPLTAGMLVVGFGSIVLHVQQPGSLVRADANECRQAYEVIRTWPGDRVLSEDISAVVLAAKPVILSNPFVYTQLENQVHWSNGTIAQLVEHQYFDLIALGGDAAAYRDDSGIWPGSTMEAIGRRYVLAYRFECSERLRRIYVRTNLKVATDLVK